MTRTIDRFSDWFASSAGSLWIFGICVAWLPFAFIGSDPHGFWFLFAATWFSAWTQPALAYGMGRIWTVIHEMLLNQHAEMSVLIAMAEKSRAEQADQDIMLEEIRNEIRRQQTLKEPILSAAISAAKDRIPGLGVENDLPVQEAGT